MTHHHDNIRSTRSTTKRPTTDNKQQTTHNQPSQPSRPSRPTEPTTQRPTANDPLPTIHDRRRTTSDRPTDHLQPRTCNLQPTTCHNHNHNQVTGVQHWCLGSRVVILHWRLQLITWLLLSTDSYLLGPRMIHSVWSRLARTHSTLELMVLVLSACGVLLSLQGRAVRCDVIFCGNVSAIMVSNPLSTRPMRCPRSLLPSLAKADLDSAKREFDKLKQVFMNSGITHADRAAAPEQEIQSLSAFEENGGNSTDPIHRQSRGCSHDGTKTGSLRPDRHCCLCRCELGHHGSDEPAVVRYFR